MFVFHTWEFHEALNKYIYKSEKVCTVRSASIKIGTQQLLCPFIYQLWTESCLPNSTATHLALTQAMYVLTFAFMERVWDIIFTPVLPKCFHKHTHTHIWNLYGCNLLLSRQLIVLVNDYPKANSLCIFGLFWEKHSLAWWSFQCTIALCAETCISYKHAYINICYIKHMKHKWEECATWN